MPENKAMLKLKRLNNSIKMKTKNFSLPSKYMVSLKKKKMVLSQTCHFHRTHVFYV